jgi:hypothetical protein
LGSLQHQDGETVKVALYLDGNDCYMINDRFVFNCFGFKEPTNVILTYEVFDNRFKMTVIKNEPIEISSSDGSDDENIIVPNPEGSNQSMEIVGEEEDDDYNSYEMPEFRNARVYDWELLITKAYASSKKAHVLVRYKHYPYRNSYILMH